MNLARKLKRYGYHRADQDGYQGEYVTPWDHKEEEFFEAARVLLGAHPIEKSPQRGIVKKADTDGTGAFPQNATRQSIR